jgi:hypothetical protein
MERVTRGKLEVGIDAAARRVELAGRIDESSQLVEIARRFTDGTLLIDLEKVAFMNSMGVREWIHLLRALSARGVKVTLSRCAEVMIHQMNMIVDARGGAEIASFYAPYSCAACGREDEACVEVAPNVAELRSLRLPTRACPECAGVMEFNDIPERYVLFLS